MESSNITHAMLFKHKTAMVTHMLETASTMTTAKSAATTSKDDTDALDRLAEQIAELAAHIHAATYRLLQLIREFDERDGWCVGFRSCAHWLSWRTGVELGAAREKVRVARALPELPRTSEALKGGRISYAKVRAMTRVATPENEDELLVIAEHGTAAQMERVVRAYRKADAADDLQLAEALHQKRFLRTRVDDDGMMIVEARLPPEIGVVVQKALELATTRLDNAGKGACQDVSAERATASQRRADALGLVAQSAIDNEMRRGSGGDRTQVLLVTQAETLNKETRQQSAAPAELQGVGPISTETARRLCCDATIVPIVQDSDGTILNVGRKRRTVPPAVRRALQQREQRCDFPCCEHRRYIEAHHIEHWADGGATSLKNTAMLCGFHHRQVHEGRCRIERNSAGVLVFFTPDGKPLPRAPKQPLAPSDIVGQLRQIHDDAGLQVNAEGLTTHNGDPLDYAWAVDTLLSVKCGRV